MFVVFAGDTYYPLGGFRDMKHCSDDLDGAFRWIEENYCNQSFDWWEIVLIKEGTFTLVKGSPQGESEL